MSARFSDENEDSRCTKDSGMGELGTMTIATRVVIMMIIAVTMTTMTPEWRGVGELGTVMKTTGMIMMTMTMDDKEDDIDDNEYDT